MLFYLGISEKRQSERRLPRPEGAFRITQRGWEKCSRSNKGVYVCM